MGGQSRIKFNTVTKEIEIEGSEKFVKTYFDKIQAMLSGTQEAVASALVKPKPTKASKEKTVKDKAIKEKPVRQVRQSKKSPEVAEPVIEQLAKKIRQSKKAQKVIKEEKLVNEPKRGDMSKAVLALILESAEGISTTELEEKTGLKDRQIWAVISYAKKAGKIRQAKRGVYVGA